MTHEVQTPVVADDAVAFTEACRYPDGANVLGATVLELVGGRIVRQVVVQAWDELLSDNHPYRAPTGAASHQSTQGVPHEP
jgi:hypothetical protein